MNDGTYLVVGDNYGVFALGKPVITISQLDALAKLPLGVLGGRKVLLLGQGVPEDRCRSVVETIQADPVHREFLDVSDLERLSDRADGKQSHKLHDYNTVIGTPIRVDNSLFIMPLLVDERCELMGDHQTGEHVQGMIVVEAFRQAFLAVTEAFFPLPGGDKMYFVINGMNVGFTNFLFPVAAEIHYRIEEKDINHRRGRFRVDVQAIQNGAVCATCDLGFTTYPADVLAAKETSLATDAVMTAMANSQPASSSLAA